jgi:hypothetical protein
LVEITDDGRLPEECIVDALVVYRRRLGATISRNESAYTPAKSDSGKLLHIIGTFAGLRVALRSFRSTGAAQFRTAFPEESLRFLRVEAVRDTTEVHYTKALSGQKPAFSENPDASVIVDRQFASRYGHHPRLLVRSLAPLPTGPQALTAAC